MPHSPDEQTSTRNDWHRRKRPVWASRGVTPWCSLWCCPSRWDHNWCWFPVKITLLLSSLPLSYHTSLIPSPESTRHPHSLERESLPQALLLENPSRTHRDPYLLSSWQCGKGDSSVQGQCALVPALSFLLTDCPFICPLSFLEFPILPSSLRLSHMNILKIIRSYN